MLDFFRNHQRLMMALLILIIVPGQGMVGIQGFSNYFDESSYVASVNGHKITRAEFDSAFRQQVDRARSMLGAQFDAAKADGLKETGGSGGSCSNARWPTKRSACI